MDKELKIPLTDKAKLILLMLIKNPVGGSSITEQELEILLDGIKSENFVKE